MSICSSCGRHFNQNKVDLDSSSVMCPKCKKEEDRVCRKGFVYRVTRLRQ